MTQVGYTGNGNHAEAGGAGSTIACTVTAVTVGNALLGMATTDTTGSPVITVADQVPTSASVDGTHISTTLSQQLSIFSLQNTLGGSRTITATYTPSASGSRGIMVGEFAGLPKTGTIVTGTPSGQDGGAGTATSFDSGNTTPGVNGVIVFGVAEGRTNVPVPNGATQLFADSAVNNITTSYLIQSVAVAVAASWTLSVANVWSALVVAYALAPISQQTDYSTFPKPPISRRSRAP